VTINGVHIYGCQKGEYALLTIIPPNEDTFPAKIVSLRDMDVDGLPDIVIVEEACMIGECIFARIYEWDGNLFQSLVSNEEEDSAFLWPGVVDIFDTDGNGTLELILKGGISGGDDYFSHGPWRLESHIFSWNGRVFVLDRVEFTPPEYRFQAVQDGDKALSQGQYGKALAYYQQAISDDMLKPWSPELREHIINVAYWDSRTPTPTPPLPDPDEIDQLVAYSQFKIIVLYTLRGMAPEAQTAYNTLLEMFPGENPGYLYTEMATGFWFEYQSSGDMVKACQKAIDYAATHSEILTPIGSDYHGWQSQIYKPEDVCLLLLGR
jgi:tetratricopeptide (TPR) repeat protein